MPIVGHVLRTCSCTRVPQVTSVAATMSYGLSIDTNTSTQSLHLSSWDACCHVTQRLTFSQHHAPVDSAKHAVRNCSFEIVIFRHALVLGTRTSLKNFNCHKREVAPTFFAWFPITLQGLKATSPVDILSNSVAH